MTPWVLVDFRSPRRPHPYFQDFWNRKGLLSETGKKKQAFYTLKAYYDRKQEQYK
jgi:beta-glucuronidase